MHDSYVQTLASFVPQAAFARGCQRLKERLAQEGLGHVPVVASHRIHSVAVAQRLLERGVCDVVGIARPLLADPQFIQKAAEGRPHDIVPCIGCNHCVNRLYTTERVTCALNPIAGYELERAWRPAPFKKSVAVVGAGAAGITCALTLWRRGHDVTLYEKGKFIGGQLNWAKMVPGKGGLPGIVLEYWTRQLRASSINIRIETEFTEAEMTKQHNFFHAVVLATGSIPKPYSSHRYPGAGESRIIVPFERILDGSVRAGRRVVILGNGAISHDVASYLLHDQRVSRSVDFFLDEWGVNLEDGSLEPPALSSQRAPRNNRDVVLFTKIHYDAQLSKGTGWSQKLWIRRHGGTIIKHAMVNNIDKDGVHVSTMPPLPERYVVPCDTIVWCHGMLPNISVGTWIYEWKKDGADKRGEMLRDFSIYVAGSCRDASTGEGRGEEDLMRAVQEGYEIGYKV
ncbi:2,4-dienoyl-CoA reductase (NADPH2) [Strigomonas culicis]|uniref:2,4-dienoyl-CoA reductase (NADPH2) n=1 Tax=Strigomonas culicis TaxID=28005 RepID=S9VZ60_9TRYP|nr:2,4-dienoyl-CoA reductase (NADPH2) [Strigomonas culicis]|eukprot:EPY28990.1 2,4-dienoyl-CoA reductase (NADPH2) [Strigomonas culicis]